MIIKENLSILKVKFIRKSNKYFQGQIFVIEFLLICLFINKRKSIVKIQLLNLK